MAPPQKEGLRWIGQRYCDASSAKLLQAGRDMGLHDGALRRVRGAHDALPWHLRLGRAAVFGAGGVVSKVLFKGFGRGTFHGADRLMAAVERGRVEGRSVVTVSNHVGTIDDPVLWGGLPWGWVVANGAANKRWIWAAQEICHKTPALAWFFGIGQCIPVVRGGGLAQPAVAELTDKMKHPDGVWCHVFAEGLCNQSGAVQPFRWGVGHLIATAPAPPIVLPFAHDGMQGMFPEAKSKAFPRFTTVTAAVGAEIDAADLWAEYQALPEAARAAGTEHYEVARIYAALTARCEAEVVNLHASIKR
eukprot:TRINITY_DN4325_c0_g1_i3.p1 TRINITY_DN4325_c0_g1~~TRINITY_DN4325_c0_g1_i3.p1  ORF type:complete len:311 (+),score=94.88 TRINITY_DN4325_c0_g1_i3:24-935(+)